MFPSIPGRGDADIPAYYDAIWSRRWLVLTLAIGCGAAAFLVSMALPRVYRASAVVQLRESGTPQVWLRHAMVDNARRVFIATPVLTHALEDPLLKAAGLTVQQVETAVEVQGVGDSTLLLVRFQATTGELAAQGANKVVEHGIAQSKALAETLLRSEVTQYEAQVESARRELTRAEANLARVQSETHSQMQSARLLAGLKRYESLEATASTARHDVAANTARASALGERLQAGEKVVALEQSFGGLDNLARTRNDPSLSALVGTNFKQETLDPVYSTTAAEMFLAQAEAESSAKRLATAQSELNDLDKKLPALELRVAAIADQMANSTREVGIARDALADVTKKLVGARTAAASVDAQYFVLDSARPPLWPIRPRPLYNTAFAIAFGLATGVLIVIASPPRADARRAPALHSAIS